LKSGSYEAYCLDQAVGYVGAVIQNALEEAGSKPSKSERNAQAAREKVLKKYLGDESETTAYADPSAFFG
jgi:hypothetical protein